MNLNFDFVLDNIPERFKDDSVSTYLLCRYSRRETLLATFDEDQRRRVDREMSRIEKLRDEFQSRERNRSTMEVFRYRQALWRVHAIERCQENQQNIKKRSRYWKDAGYPEEIDRMAIERRILDDVRRWHLPDVPRRPKVLGQEAEDNDYSENRSSNFFRNIFGRNKPQERMYSEPWRRAPDIIPEQVSAANWGISVYKITLTKSSDTSSFTTYKTNRYPLGEVLDASHTNPLAIPAEANTIRYFHFPANCMFWIEEAIARYYGEHTPAEYNYRRHERYATHSSNLLRREFWTSLQKGEIYDRQMQPRSSLIMPDNNSKNFAIFMPYLHWETYERRKRMAEVMQEEIQRDRKDRRGTRGNSRMQWETLLKEIGVKTAEDRHQTALFFTEAPEGSPTSKKKRNRSLRRSKLGEYLLQIAKLYNALNIELDIQLLRGHLFKDPPLHARRSLHQSYWRDEEQVLYRETQRGESFWRTPQVLMLDQLWLYVLDDNTIISSFPKRWGCNKPDWSSVHKGIRKRLDMLHEGEIRSVYDMALLIMDQCSKVFFDSSVFFDERPELVKIFSNALSNVSEMQRVNFETFWRQIDRLSSGKFKTVDSEIQFRRHLSINIEGQLTMEIHSIIEQARMISQIFTDQLQIVETFSEQLHQLHEFESVVKNLSENAPSIVLNTRTFFEQAPMHTSQVGKEGFPSINSSTIDPTPQMFKQGRPYGTETPDAQSPHVNSIPTSTLRNVANLHRDISQRRREFQTLEERAVLVSTQLRDHLDIKQQQASIFEAKYAVKQSHETISQGRSIMTFTIVTIVFLPLSFMSSVFGMNASDFSTPDGGNSMSLSQQFRLLFPISIGVIIISISLAFSRHIRYIVFGFAYVVWRVVFFVVSIVWAIFLEYTYLRHITSYFWRQRDFSLEESRRAVIGKIYSRKERQWRKGLLQRQEELEANLADDIVV
ncbi:hypothetical protein BKA65DRAFT_442771 [Rhexocercosporidium sp. MPI-PUGE-AT-0058]|nr:hypothetical protein BKA65DRAFT_442771 [Rhexocercosporidium sp. MPI-PUGE-AT-0058]